MIFETSSSRPYYEKEHDYRLHDFEPSECDVICGRGKTGFGHPGNVFFRNLIDQNLSRYQSALTKAEKSSIVVEIVGVICSRAGQPSGGFVRKNVNCGSWFALSETAKREKVGHAIRDAIIARKGNATRRRKHRVKPKTSSSSLGGGLKRRQEQHEQEQQQCKKRQSLPKKESTFLQNPPTRQHTASITSPARAPSFALSMQRQTKRLSISQEIDLVGDCSNTERICLTFLPHNTGNIYEDDDDLLNEPLFFALDDLMKDEIASKGRISLKQQHTGNQNELDSWFGLDEVPIRR